MCTGCKQETGQEWLDRIEREAPFARNKPPRTSTWGWVINHSGQWEDPNAPGFEVDPSSQEMLDARKAS